MNLKYSQKRTLACLLCICLPLLSACATAPAGKDGIEQRAMARWDALLSGDYETAYGFLTPGYRSSVQLSSYRRSILASQVKWLNAEYIESECTETVCKVRISLEFALINALRGVEYLESDQDIDESWLLVDDNWYLVLE